MYGAHRFGYYLLLYGFSLLLLFPPFITTSVFGEGVCHMKEMKQSV